MLLKCFIVIFNKRLSGVSQPHPTWWIIVGFHPVSCSVIVSIPDTFEAISKPFYTLFCQCQCASIGTRQRWREDDLFDHKSLRFYRTVRVNFNSIRWNGLAKIRQGGQAESVRSWPRYHGKEEQDSFIGVKSIRQPLTKASECSEFMIKLLYRSPANSLFKNQFKISTRSCFFECIWQG